ncbi:class I SAM-dependent methyltransferase, partial [Acidobacteria bacterium AH-259-O06]|nr:class I SAM-dependent methyltransferase [Acidobacteria bacterium AH-259-O06]
METISSFRRRCAVEKLYFDHIKGVWQFLTPERKAYFNQFTREYEIVRRSEGRGSSTAEFYRALPFRDLSERFRDSWRIRAISFRVLLKTVVPNIEEQRGPFLRILDLGAGNCWLSKRLAEKGHGVAAVDLITNTEDGLGAHVHYQQVFTPVQADFDHLPFGDDQFDLAIFNSAFHYSTNYEKTLQEACRVLGSSGRVVIMDSPLYHHSPSGQQMLQEREACFRQKYGFPSNALPSENFLTYRRLDELTITGLKWQLHRPFYGWRWALKPWKARLLGHREPAQFGVIV